MTELRHLTDIASLNDETLISLLDRSLEIRDMMDRREYPDLCLAGRLQYNLFYENSTRTNLSFEVAAKRLGAIVSVVPVAASSIHKGESLKDTVLTLCAQGADYLVLRAKEPGTIQTAINAIDMDGWRTSVLNGGEGALGHPTQGLLDAAAILYAKGRKGDDGLDGLTIAICGDVRHSRVAASAIEIFSRLGATIRLAGPQMLLPETRPDDVDSQHTDLDDALTDADIVMGLRIQKERLEAGLGLVERDYHAQYGITYERLRHAKPDALIMHPGPMNRGVEMADDVADDPERSIIRSQVRQGVAIRMAVLERLEQSKRAA